MPYKDRKKQLAYQSKWNRKYYAENRDSEVKRIAKRKKEIGKWFGEYKRSLVCLNCKETDPVCLEFHHINSKNKEFNLATAYSWGWGIDRIKKEINKCVVLCSNCHRKLHAKHIKMTDIMKK